MSNSYAEDRNLQGSDPESDNFMVLGADDYYTEDSDDDPYIPFWLLWTLVVVASLVIAGVIFYFSYKQEICCGIHKKDEEVEGDGE